MVLYRAFAIVRVQRALPERVERPLSFSTKQRLLDQDAVAALACSYNYFQRSLTGGSRIVA